MGLLSKSSSSTGSAASESASDAVDIARTKARRRLIGAAVLLGVGVVAFPLIFETQPRPIPVDIAIAVPSRDDAKPLTMPAAPRAVAPTEPAVVAPPASQAVPVKPAKKLPDIVEKAEPPKPVAATSKPAVATPKPAETKPAETKPQPSASAVPAASRLVIQVGAFAEDEAVREVRSKVEKLGLKTYIQTVDTKEGKRTRVRIGPYSSRDEVDKAAAKLKSTGLTVSVLEL
jgi:DedD protein